MNRSTILRLVIVALLASVLCGARVSAQAPPPVSEDAAPSKPPVVPAKPVSVAPAAESKMPDISGTWLPDKTDKLHETVIRRILDDEAFLVIDRPGGREFQVRWAQDTHRFEETIVNVIPKRHAKVILQLLPDDKTMRVTYQLDEQAREDYKKNHNLSDSELDERSIREWTRKKTPLKTDVPTTRAVSSPSVRPAFTVSQQPSPPKDIPEQTPVTKPAKAPAAEEDHIKVFSLANGSALEYSKLLKDLYDDVKITPDARTNSIIAASPDEQRLMAIEAILLRLDEAPSKPAASVPDSPAEERQTMVWRLQNASATETCKLLKDLSADVVIVADTATNSLIISSTKAQSKFITALVKKLDDSAAKPRVRKTDLAIAFTPAPSPPSVGMPSSPEARKLSEYVAEHEAKAKLLANEIRGLSQQLGPKHPKLVEARRQLEETLASALATKFKLEQLQITSLEERLVRLKAQIGQRQAVGKQIVERRARELIDGDVLRWSPDASRSNQDAASTVRGETSSTSKTMSPPKADEIVIDLYAGSGVLPGLSQNPKYSRLIQSLNGLKGVVTNIRESGPGVTISMAIVRDPSGRLLREIQPNETASELFSTIHSALKIAGIENIRWEGHPVADATSSNEEASNPAFAPSNAPKLVPLRENMQQVTIDFPIANFPVIPGDRIEVQHALHAEEGFQGPAKIIASGLEVVGVARSLSTPTRTALTLATTHEVAAMLEHLATTGLLFCHPLDPVAMLPCGRAVRIPLGIRQEGRLTVGDLVQVDRMSLAIGKNNLAEPKFTGFATGLLIGFEEGDVPEGTTEPKTIVKLLLPKDSNIDAHVFQNRVDELIRDGTLFRGKRSERGDTTQFHVAVTEIEWQIESLEKRIAYYQEHVIKNPAPDKVQLNLGYQRIRLEQLKAQQTLYKTSSDVMARVRPLNSAANDAQSPP